MGAAAGRDVRRYRRSDPLVDDITVGRKDFAWALVSRFERTDQVLRIPANWEDVTFDIPPGEVSVLLGSSGTGKSVFLRSQIILRDEPDSGLAVRTALLAAAVDRH
jgi:ABC-type polysaccharide/polyol phosphate transport system ATPase subunit